MIEVAIGLLLVAAVVAAGMAAWRLARGPARRPLTVAGRAFAVSLVVVPLAFFGIWKLSKARTWQFYGGLVRRVDTTEPLVALTFDDGPTPQHLDEVLSLLREEGVKATFFVTGRELEAHPEEARRIVADGHQLGNHTYSHATMIARSLLSIREEIERTDELIRAAGYRGDIYFRAPGCKKLILLPYYLWRTNRKTIIWDIEPESYPGVAAGAGRIASHVLENARPGSIILLHVMYDSRAETWQALPLIIEGLRDEGYRFVTVSELLVAE